MKTAVHTLVNALKGTWHLGRQMSHLITNQNMIQEEIKRRLNSGNACYHSVQNLLSSRLLSKNVEIRIYEYKNYKFACGSVWV
jgi:hypothetical protein